VYHGVTDLHARWETIGKDTARFAFKDGHEAACRVHIRVIKVKGAGQLTFEALRYLTHFFDISRPHNDPERAEHFVP
jgi:hypothetical protein